MMGLSSHLRILLCMEPCDMRKSYHGLAALAEHLAPDGLNLLSENELLPQKIDTLIKLLYGAKSEKIDPAQLQLLIEGLDPGKLDSPSGDDTQEAEGDAEKKSSK